MGPGLGLASAPSCIASWAGPRDGVETGPRLERAAGLILSIEQSRHSRIYQSPHLAREYCHATFSSRASSIRISSQSTRPKPTDKRPSAAGWAGGTAPGVPDESDGSSDRPKKVWGKENCRADPCPARSAPSGSCVRDEPVGRSVRARPRESESAPKSGLQEKSTQIAIMHTPRRRARGPDPGQLTWDLQRPQRQRQRQSGFAEENFGWADQRCRTTRVPLVVDR